MVQNLLTPLEEPFKLVCVDAANNMSGGLFTKVPRPNLRNPNSGVASRDFISDFLVITILIEHPQKQKYSDGCVL